MAGLQSALSVLPAIEQGINIASQLGVSDDRQDEALENLRARQNEQLRTAQENATLERERIALAAAQSEENRQKALKRAVARQRTLSNARGVAQSGSNEAVLLGLFEESDAERQDREALDQLRLNAIDQDINRQSRINVLQQTQLKQREGISGLGQVSQGLSALSRLF